MGASEERYIRATHSSHLKVTANTVCDVDLLIAAGKAVESLGTRLMRLRAEFDKVRRAHLAAQANYETAIRAANAERRLTAPKTATQAELQERAEEAAKRAAQMRETAEGEALTARLLILMDLKSLIPAKQALGAYAVDMVERRDGEDRRSPTRKKAEVDRRHSGLPVGEIEKIVGAVLDAWLDRICHKCEGRGFNGGYDGPTIRCRYCRETGNRRLGLFSDRLAGQMLAERLIVVMDRKCEEAQRQMRYLMRG